MTGVGLCRVTVRTLPPRSEAVVDLALPTRLQVGELLPDIVDLVGERAREGERWRLSRLDGSVLVESAAVEDSRVEDGDVLLLSDETSLPTPRYGDMSHYVLDASASADRDTDSARRMGPVALLWSAAFGATTLAVPGPATPDIRGAVAV